jgi:hypothetical protein
MLPTNVSFDVYRGFNPNAPYLPPNSPAALAGVRGFLRQHVRNGRFGKVVGGVAIYWTTVLDVADSVDIRSAYNAELNPFHQAQGDTVMLHDYPRPGTCTAFCVVMVQRRLRGRPGTYLRCYLDRTRPSYGTACPDPTQVRGAQVPCCAGTLPVTLFATIFTDFQGACPCLACTIPMNFNPFTLHWTGTNLTTCGASWFVDLTCQEPFVDLVFDCTLLYGGASAMRLPQNATCAPVTYQGLWVVSGACAEFPGVSTGSLVITQ